MSLGPLRPTGNARRQRADAVTQEWLNLIDELKHAISDDELRVYLQPVVGVDRRVIGFESLVRWQNPTRGLLKPGQFIPIAESTGMIVEIGEWMIESACRTLGRWRTNERMRDLKISVNVSERQLRNDVLLRTVSEAFDRCQVSEGRLILEVTESLMHADLEQSSNVLEMIRALGVSVALDDFGTGYSSLSYLRHLPVNVVKIDRSFVNSVTEDEKGAALIGLIVEFARVLGLSVVAEGIETAGQFERLRELGVVNFQGYLFGEPKLVEEVERSFDGSALSFNG